MVNNKISSIPFSQKRQISIRRRFFFFSTVFFLLILILGSFAFVIFMRRIRYENAGHELMQTVEMKKLKLEASLNSEIAIALKMADSSLIQRYFLNPMDKELQKFAFEEIAGYRRAFAGKNVFWINDIDKNYYFGDEHVYTLDPADESSQWYNSIMKNADSYRLMVNFDIGIKSIMLWIDSPVYDNDHNPVGVVGTGVNLSDFINAIYQDYKGDAELYFFNSAGEITGAEDIDLVENKINITRILDQTGGDIFVNAKKLKAGEVRYVETNDRKGIAAYCSIPVLDWYVTAVLHFTVRDSLKTGMTVLFGVMMGIILFVFVFFNLFIFGMMEPLNRMVKAITQTLSDWEVKPETDDLHKDEIGTMGELFNLTIIDQLTGIYNRRYFDGNMKKIIRLHSRASSSLSLLMLDIDYFKKYNDTYGHDAGDDCLKTVAAAISQCVPRDEDFAARYGGEEFVIVLPNTDKNGAQVVAENILNKIRERCIPHKASDAADHVTVSIGGTTGIVKHSQNGGDYVKSADKALYESKKNGRNRYTFENLDE